MNLSCLNEPILVFLFDLSWRFYLIGSISTLIGVFIGLQIGDRITYIIRRKNKKNDNPSFFPQKHMRFRKFTEK